MKILLLLVVSALLSGCAMFTEPEPYYRATHQDLVLMARWESLVKAKPEDSRVNKWVARSQSEEGKTYLDIMRGRKAVWTRKELDDARVFIQKGIEEMAGSCPNIKYDGERE